jgi:2'-5' RNA ligase/GNAT superfamily N-acetyltransferase
MARRRFGVVLLVPQPVASEVDVLRRALGVDDIERIPPHITITPPANVAEAAVDEVFGLLNDVAAGTAPITATLGPAATFWPRSPVVFLDVGGDEARAAIATLYERTFVPPLSRPLGRAFVPHVTIADRIAEARIAGAVDAARGYEAVVRFDGIHLLEHVAGPEGRIWRPVHDAPFAVPAVVGRGGVEIELTSTSGLPLDVQRFVRRSSLESYGGALVRDAWQPLGTPFVITARRADHEVVGVLAGWYRGDLATVDDVIVADAERRHGVGRHLLARAESDVAGEGVAEMVAVVPRLEPAVALFRSAGWVVESRLPGATRIEADRLVRIVPRQEVPRT